MSSPARAPAPFTCTFSREVPDVLRRLGATLAVTTYQAGKVALIGAHPDDADRIVQLTRTFRQPMGIAVEGAGATLRLAIATRDEVVTLANAPRLAAGYPRKPNTYDALLVPRSRLHTGTIDLHDLAWGTHDGYTALWGVNTAFSALCVLDDAVSFRPVWTPPFVSAVVPEDRCHLNGMALHNGTPAFVTALGTTDTAEGWRTRKLDGGVLLDVASGEVVLSGLAMPHSPRLVTQPDGSVRLYTLASARGEVLAVDPAAGTATVVAQLPGFVRGLAAHGGYLFVGLSRLRRNRTFGDLPLAQRDDVFAGLVVLHEATGAVVGHVRYETSVEEIYDVQVLPGVRRPGLLGVEDDTFRRALVTPTSAYWAAPDAAPATPDAGQ
ncbi:MAG: TIGR03032 family protein [Bacteroidota bacterium]